MKARILRQLMLYNYRYVFAYTVIIAFALYFLGWRLGSIGPGLSAPELEVAARTSSISSILTMPLHPLHSFLQWASLHVFDVHVWSVRLPSVLLAGFTAFLLYTLLKKWFGKVTALLSIALFLSADWFLFVARLGTGAIEFTLWFTLMLFSLMKLIEKKPKWLLGYVLSASMMLFVPYGVYAVIATTVCLFSFKMFRSRANEANLAIKLASYTLALATIGLVGYLSYRDLSFLRNLLGITQLPSAFEYFKNLVLNSSGVVMLWPDNNPLLGPSGIFMIRFFEFVFMLFGVIMLWVTRVNRLNMVVLINAVILALVSGLHSGSRGGSLLLVPGLIFMTAGLRHFLHRWQRTFPKNPYAKVALYVPLICIILSAVMLHFQSYFVLWPRQTATTQVFTQDLMLLKDDLDKHEGDSCAIVGADTNTRKLLTQLPPKCQTTFYQPNQAIAQQAGLRLYANRTLQSKLHTAGFELTPLVNANQEQSTRWLVAQL